MRNIDLRALGRFADATGGGRYFGIASLDSTWRIPLAVDFRAWILAGGVAGAVINVSGITLAYAVLGREYSESYVSHMASAPAASDVALHGGLRMAFGFLVVFLTVALRPAFGSGPRTALIAGLFVWLSAYAVLTLTLNQFGILAGWRLWVAIVWGLAEACAAAFVGSWICSDRRALTTEFGRSG